MRYPYIAYSDKVTVHPLFKWLTGEPFVISMAAGSDLYDQVDLLNQRAFQEWLDKKIDRNSPHRRDQVPPLHKWGVASYLENREPLLYKYPQMKEEQRYFHLGLDIIVGCGVPLYAPLDAVVKESGYEEGEGNYGGNVLLMHESPFFETFYSLYGHLNRERLPAPGDSFRAGEAFAFIGDFHENGNWFYHTHLQVITQKGYEQGFVSKGYCSAEDLKVIDTLCPSPLLLFKT
ncbi:Peptidase M23 [Desulfamplus magnetovallimortis]|uniref:Peptidase M23 n=1 Tax=Desulfamplus magnetovallimortis TaxID=1246637 RepID=A0A1W1H7M1_9BACT|nr:peptidoglycan DD-metalloendopeptidase family protein [Desulfamplus magnetovallimortis]SLM28472.1 Peptidase M23 [Desulfamplus magnetovallimortis]